MIEMEKSFDIYIFKKKNRMQQFHTNHKREMMII